MKPNFAEPINLQRVETRLASLWKIWLVLLDSIPEAVWLKNLRSLDWRIMESKKVMEEEEEMWRREIVTSVMRIVSTRLPQRDLISLLLVSPWLYRTLVSYPSIWLVNKSLTLLLSSFQVFNFTTMLFFRTLICVRGPMQGIGS